MSKTLLSSQIIELEKQLEEREHIISVYSAVNDDINSINKKLKEEIAELKERIDYYKTQVKGYSEAVDEWSLKCAKLDAKNQDHEHFWLVVARQSDQENAKLKEENEKLIAEIKKLSESNDEFKKEFAKTKSTYTENMYRYENDKLRKEINCFKRSNDSYKEKISNLEADKRAQDSNIKTLLKENTDMRADLALNTIAKIKQLKEENKHLYDLNHDQKEEIKRLKFDGFKLAQNNMKLEVIIEGYKKEASAAFREKVATDNFEVELDTELMSRIAEWRKQGRGAHESKQLARRDMIFELAKGVKSSTQDKNMIRLAYAIKQINHKIGGV